MRAHRLQPAPVAAEAGLQERVAERGRRTGPAPAPYRGSGRRYSSSVRRGEGAGRGAAWPGSGVSSGSAEGASPWFHGQAVWQSSQPKAQRPRRAAASGGTSPRRSMVQKERQRRASTRPGLGDGAGGAGREAGGAAPAALRVRRVGVELAVGEDHRQDHPAPVVHGDEAAVLPHPPHPGPLRPGLLHHRPDVAAGPQPRLRDPARRARRPEHPELPLHHAVVVAAAGIAGHRALEGPRRRALPGVVREGQGDHASGPRQDAPRVQALRPLGAQPGHVGLAPHGQHPVEGAGVERLGAGDPAPREARPQGGLLHAPGVERHWTDLPGPRGPSPGDPVGPSARQKLAISIAPSTMARYGAKARVARMGRAAGDGGAGAGAGRSSRETAWRRSSACPPARWTWPSPTLRTTCRTGAPPARAGVASASTRAAGTPRAASPRTTPSRPRWLTAVRRSLKPGGTIWVSGTQHVIFSIGYAMQELGYHLLNTVTWYKPNASPNLACRFFTHSTEILLWASPTRAKPLAHRFNYQEMKTAQRRQADARPVGDLRAARAGRGPGGLVHPHACPAGEGPRPPPHPEAAGAARARARRELAARATWSSIPSPAPAPPELPRCGQAVAFSGWSARRSTSTWRRGDCARRPPSRAKLP